MSLRNEKILIYGAGDAGRMIARELRGQYNDIVGFVDDDPLKESQLFESLPVLGTGSDLESIIRQNKISRLLIALPSAPAGKIREIFSLMQGCPEVEVDILPTAVKYYSSPLSNELKPSEFEYLFERDELSIDFEMLSKFYSSASVLVTGAGGSIGSELCRNLLRLGVRRLICLGRGENSMYELAASLNQYHGAKSEISCHIADVRNYEHLRKVFSDERPDYCFHAAAHKHVPLMEDNVYEAIHNNCFGSNNLFRVCVESGVRKCILVSTDKAVVPSSVMGATKRVAELLALSCSGKNGTKISAVRFGNVIGSRGSVLPLFMRQIRSGDALTVTDESMERYFMSITESTLLMLNALTIADGKEIFVLDMGKPHRIIDIAKRMLALNNIPYEVGKSVRITGLRPGEKLTERLFSDNERITSTAHPQILAVRNVHPLQSVDGDSLKYLVEAAPEQDQCILKKKLFDVVK